MSHHKQLSDPDFELVRRCRDVNDEAFEEAFERLYLGYRDRAYSIAYRMTGSATDAMDVVQESFSLLFRKISTFRFDSLFSTWLFRIVVNCSIDQNRRERSRHARVSGSLSALGASVEPQDPSGDPPSQAEANELGVHVHAALQRLTPKLRAVLVLRYLEGLSYEQLAETLDTSLGTIKSRLARAHLALERVLRGRLSALGYTPAEPVSDGKEGVA